MNSVWIEINPRCFHSQVAKGKPFMGKVADRSAAFSFLLFPPEVNHPKPSNIDTTLKVHHSDTL